MGTACVYVVATRSADLVSDGYMVANLARGQLSREFPPLSLFLYLRVLLREKGSVVPSRVSPLISVFGLKFWCPAKDYISFSHFPRRLQPELPCAIGQVPNLIRSIISHLSR